METSPMIFEKPGKDISLPQFEIETLINTYLSVKKIRKNIPHIFQFSVRMGRTWTGEIVGYSNNKIILSHKDASTKDVTTIISQNDLEAVSLNWTPEFARYFTTRFSRDEFPRLGGLQLNQLLPKLTETLPNEMKLKLRTEGDWKESTEEDFLIFEDHLAILIQNLVSLKKDFPNEVAKLTSLAFTKGEDFAILAQPGELIITLPFESMKTLNSFGLAAEHLNQQLTNI